ncbi:FAD-binding oxidoreductase [Roseibium sp. HPY-6]|uniref:NAD(P)/FAD-dependent oxidoreductase n=1 Tax=Roseibium sp. HPY-6 TaxID=3229852 RepID=UPI00338EF980
MTPSLSSVPSDLVFPGVVDVVVIGGGIAGVAAAWQLALRGTKVALIEKGVIAGEQSCRNWGWCRQQNRDERELPLSILSLQMWEDLAHQAGGDVGFRRSGLVYASSRESDLAGWEAWGRMAKGYGVDTRMCSARDLKNLLPGNIGQWIGGVHSPTDGRAEPALATPVLAEAARQAGAVLFQHCAAREIEFSAGRVSAVVTEKGTVQCQCVLVAGGAWSGMFLRHHGVDIFQASIQSTSFATQVAPEIISGGVSMPDLAIRRRTDGRYTVGLSGFAVLHLSPMGLRQWRPFLPTFIERWRKMSYTVGTSFFNGPDAHCTWKADGLSPFEKTRILNPKSDQRSIKRGLQRLAKVYPDLRGVGVDHEWGGMVDYTPDAIPVIGPVASKPGLFISTGYSAHGFGIGPAAGKLAADLITGSPPCVDPTPFRYERMIDGTDLGSVGMI